MMHLNQFYKRVIWLMLIAGMGFGLLAILGTVSQGTLLALPTGGSDETAVSSSEAQTGLANCRYGVTTVKAPIDPWVSTLGTGWYLEFFTRTMDPTANNAEFVQVIRVKQDKTAGGTYLNSFTTTPALGSATLDTLIAENPSAVWVVGNEVDRGPNPGANPLDRVQDDTFPHIYARAYHDTYEYIKERDPSARIANSALVQVTPNRLQYLDLMWQAYLDMYGSPMPVDIWNMHIYILPEVNPQGMPNAVANVALGTDPRLAKKESGFNPALCVLDSVYCFAEHDDINIFMEQVTDMRQWMKDHGQQNKPLILSEYSILYPNDDDGETCHLQDEFDNCFTPERVQQFMTATLNYLETAQDPALGHPLDSNRLVQSWLWFSGKSGGVGYVSDLVNDDLTALTPLGEIYQSRISQQPITRNLLVSQVHNSAITTDHTGVTTATLSIDILNNGNHAIEQPYEVTFYENAAMTIPISTVTISPVQRGCATHNTTATVEWPNRTPGKHTFWVMVDSNNVIIESIGGSVDNVASGFVLVNPENVSLPVIIRP